MENLIISGTESTPEINFNHSSGIFEIRGESYPENTAAFYAPVYEWLNNYFAQATGKSVTLNVEIIYFNSSSSKALMNLFDLLSEVGSKGNAISVNWIYDEDNESGLEYGEEFKEDVGKLEFNLVVKNS
ncbi:MAG: DUF1987 domain-containing protein [Gallionellaceae bacterium]|nr:MAG: DUF1987 domain-containing protein [Gallionellaceae bacterium]